MRLLKRNKQQIYYKLYVDKKPIKNEYGHETGEYEVIYSDPESLKVNISPARGETSTRQFGDYLNYERVIITDWMECPIDESSILWVDNLDTSKPHDYIVKRVAKSLNSVSIAVSKVSVSA